MLHPLRALWIMVIASPVSSYSTTATFIADFIQFQRQAAHPSTVRAFVCWKEDSTHHMLIHFSQQLVFLSVHPVSQDILPRFQNTGRDGYVTFVLDMGCHNATALLQEANELQMLRTHYRWFLLQNSNYAKCSRGKNASYPQTSECMNRPRYDSETADDVDAFLENLNILLDSDVTIARRFSEKTFLLLEVYKRRALEGLVKKRIGDWSEGRGVRLTTSPLISARRLNLHKTLIKAVMVVTDNNTLDHLDDNVDKHIDTYMKTCYAHFKHVIEILNASVHMTVTDTWGHSLNGSWTGLTGFLQREEADIGSTGMFLLKGRLPVVNFIAAPIPTRSAFLFRRPPLSFTTNIFILPFSRAVWLVSAALIALISFLLYCDFRWEFSKKEDEQQTMNWSDVVLLSLGTVCQQGSTLEARGISGRIITIMLYIAVIFLYTSYSACIVALLQSTTDSIRNLEDLYQSGMGLGVLDMVYSRHYFSTASDPLRRAIYTQRVSPPGRTSNFLSVHEGLERVRKGLFAFHHELGVGYKTISDTFLEEEKCGLQTVICFVEFVDPWISVSKQTPFKEILSIAYRIIHERGLQVRENWRYYQKKPECGGLGSSFVSVGIADFYPALLVLLYGLLCSVVVLLLEILAHKRFHHHLGLQCQITQEKRGCS